MPAKKYRGVELTEDERNKKGARVNWRFTTENARVKLKTSLSCNITLVDY
jgi:hypothetical protein